MSERLPYRYRLIFTVVVDGDGQHVGGDGAAETRKRLAERLASDPRVVEVRPPSMPTYIGASPALASRREVQDA